MPRFYFDFCDAESVQKDPEGTEMNSVQRARDAAMSTLTEVVRGRTFASDTTELAVVVRDITNATVLKATLSLLVSYPEQAFR